MHWKKLLVLDKINYLKPAVASQLMLPINAV